jgi:hypothetical protein
MSNGWPGRFPVIPDVCELDARAFEAADAPEGTWAGNIT